MQTSGHLVLASGSPYRARLLSAAGYTLVVDPPRIDERAADHLLERLGPGGLAVELARRKVLDVAGRHPGRVVLGGDQVGVVGGAGPPRQLTKQPDLDAAVAQLMAIAGTTHRLYNGMWLVSVGSGEAVSGIDVQTVTMRGFSEEEAREYVERFEPFDTAGAYRMEDGEAMAPLVPFVTSVVGEDPSGVLGVPIPMLGRLESALASSLRQAGGSAGAGGVR